MLESDTAHRGRQMEIVLTAMEIRVLGSLIEKELATPEYYPLSLNALTNACNQKSNREPVVSYDDQMVAEVVEQLQGKELVWKSTIGRVPKFEERFTHSRNFVPRESAVMCVLFLRGPQTVGEIRGHTTRLYAFQDLQEVQTTLDNLTEWGYVRQLPRLPGHKEARFCHLLDGQTRSLHADIETNAARAADPYDARLTKMEQDMQMLRNELKDLRDMLEAFKTQFE
jgi:uncharacterized protein